MARGIDEHIICIAAGIQLGQDMPVLGGKIHQGRRLARDDQKPAHIAIDGHWEIRSGPLRRQRSGHRSRKIHDLDFTSVRRIDKDLGSGFVDLKPLGMSLEADIPDAGSGFRIDHREPAFAITYDHAVALRIHPHTLSSSLPSSMRPDSARSSPRSTRSEPSPPFATKTLSAEAT
jgi:hypothetical protein